MNKRTFAAALVVGIWSLGAYADYVAYFADATCSSNNQPSIAVNEFGGEQATLLLAVNQIQPGNSIDILTFNVAVAYEYGQAQVNFPIGIDILQTQGIQAIKATVINTPISLYHYAEFYPLLLYIEILPRDYSKTKYLHAHIKAKTPAGSHLKPGKGLDIYIFQSLCQVCESYDLNKLSFSNDADQTQEGTPECHEMPWLPPTSKDP